MIIVMLFMYCTYFSQWCHACCQGIGHTNLMVIRMIFCAFGVVGSCIDFKIGLIWDVLQCINMQALGIPI